MKSTLRTFLTLAALCSPVHAEPADSNSAADRTQWFREARFGMFIHWGVYAVPAGEWNGETIKGIGEWIMRFRKVPVAKYKSYAPDFTAAKYDPEYWAELAKMAGMKYVVITSKHHDGFALYDSAVSEWDVMASGAKRDLLDPLAHIWDWPADGKILLPTLKELPTSGILLKGGAAITAERTTDGVVLHLPGTATDSDVSVARLDFPGALTITQKAYNTPDADGFLTLSALDADPHGAVGGNIRVEGSGATAYLTDWKQPDYRVEYHLKTGKAAKWNITAEIAASEPAKLSIRAGTATHVVDIPATGSTMTWKTISLGTIELPAEEAILELKPVPGHWQPIQLRKLKLQP